MAYLTLLFSSLLLSLALALPQGPNTLYVNNPNLRTESYNATYFILAVADTILESLIPYPLIPVPRDTSIFVTPFPAGYHPVIVSSGYMNDIRMSIFQIASLVGAQIAVPYVDRLENGETSFLYPLINYIGGANGEDLMSLVPCKLRSPRSPLGKNSKRLIRHEIIAIVGTFEGVYISPASLTPNTAAYVAITPTEFTVEVKTVIVPNFISGPSVVYEDIDLDFMSDPSPNTVYTAHTFHALINQALVLNNGMCQCNTYFFNQTFTDPLFRVGTVTIGAPPVGTTGLAGVYSDVPGYSASSVLVGFNAQDCADAAAAVDKSALQ
ncbi:MAG: hypothetical protein MMC33_005439 [Icmadophila ericetorum]|nr:hypothetical protein [Icmadophila ericetorum]